MKIKAGVLGVSGYTGQELIQLLYHHPKFEISSLFSSSHSGDYTDLNPKAFHFNLPPVKPFNINDCSDLSLLFLAVPHTKAMPYVSDLRRELPQLKIIDLSADYRLKDATLFQSYYHVDHLNPTLLSDTVYGLPELYFDQIKSASLVANPGCYATAMILGCLPLKDQLPKSTPIVIDAKSGVSGAGRSLKESSLFCEVHDSLSAYATGDHRHEAELIQEVGLTNVMFSPHLVPMDRGIEAAIYIQNKGFKQTDLIDLYRVYFNDKPFVNVLDSISPSTKLVKGTNQCILIPIVKDDWIVVFSLLDNLVKGASGQALQNANIMFGLNQTDGLI